MHNIFNKLFGWKYVVVNYGARHYVRRVQKSSLGVEFVCVHDTYMPLNEPYRVVLRLHK